jgi:DNA polymerase-3 subunit gamma/tau
MLSSNAFNAFLKTLEEPPSHAVFILATTEKHKIIPTILSRCQIFDFNRIKVADIVSYLGHISAQEGVEFEEDAFNVIALKADGAMRDALSIYDQMVSFSGKKILYKDVIENLNILDYEYYFKVTRSCFTGQVGETLLIFDEILSRGFDAHNFLSGFNSHLRDLLVSLDEVTLKLLEVGAGIREQYRAQSRELDQPWLYAALDILGTADVSFKTSRNQRLHVELALLRLCRLREDPKKKVLSPETEAEKAPEKLPEKNPEPVPEPLTKPAAAAVTQPAADPDSGPKPEPQEPVRKSPAPAQGKMPSIKDALNGVHKRKETKVTGEPVKKQVLSEPFSQEDLLEQWEAFTESIKETKPRMANSLKHHLPVLGDALQIELELSNSAQLEEFNRDIKPLLLSYLEKGLQNNQFKLFPVISKQEEQQNSLYTSEEKYDHMLKKNPELGKLKERFNLDFE